MAMSAVAGGNMNLDEAFADIMASCLQCRACEVVCPAQVPFGRAMEGARAEMTAQRPNASTRVRHFVVGRVLAAPRLMRLLTVGVRIVQKLRADRLLPSTLREGFSGIRPVRPVAVERGATYRAIGPPIGSVGFLAGCVMDVWFSEVHAASIGLLQLAGYDVVVPEGQTCCGALAAHDGAADATRRLALANVAAFAGVDAIVVDSAGCGAHMKDYPKWIGEANTSFSSRVIDITEIIASAIENGQIPVSTTDRGEVAVQDPCHLRHAQRVVDPPRAVVRAAGYTAVEIDPTGQCCGAAGIYSLLQPELSKALGAAKADQVRSSAAMVVASANPGCEMQLRNHLGPDFEIVHPVELLWQAVGDQPPDDD